MAKNTIHSKFLIHWTGKDFDSGNNINNDIRKEYVKRLKNICEQGFRMNPGTEKIWGINNKWIEITISRICFTEIRLSQTQEPPKRFGKLGIGVHRDFVIERHGNPVFYVQSGDKGIVVENLDILYGFVKKKSKTGDKMIETLDIILGYLKNMSDQNQSELKYYEEMEWRIVHLDELMDKYISKKDKEKNVYRLNLKPEDIRTIIFPDYKTLTLALKNKTIKNFFKKHIPTITTLDDCENF